MDISTFLEVLSGNGLAVALMVPLALYFKKLNDETIEYSRKREEAIRADSREREERLYERLKANEDSNRDLVRNNAVIANTNAQLCNDMKIELESIDGKVGDIAELLENENK